jgi:excisionase family DNA binding protein
MPEISIGESDLLSIQDAAKELKRPRLTLYRWVKKGRVIGIRIGGVLFIPKIEVQRLKGESLAHE